MNIIRSIWRRKVTVFNFFISLLVLYWVYYSYNLYEFGVFISYFALLIAAIAALAALLSLKYTRDTVRPFISFKGTINLGSTTLAFPITNTGSMPADDVRIKIDPFGVDEEIELENVSRRYERFFDEEGEGHQEALVLFPNQTWQSVFNVNLTREYDRELRGSLLNGDVKLRITISYSSFRRRHQTIQTVAFDELSLSSDQKEFHGLSVKPQKWG